MSRIILVAASAALFTASNSSGQQFGGALAVSDGHVLVGESANQTLSGLVYVYGQEGGEWVELEQLAISDELRAPDGFGRALATVEGWLIAGAPLEQEGRGSFYVFRRDASGSWPRVDRIEGPATSGRFGSSVAGVEDVVWVGAPGAGEDPGAVHSYRRRSGGDWIPGPVLDAPDGAGPGFGSTMAFDGETLVVATRVQRGGGSQVYAYRSDEGAWDLEGGLAVEELEGGSGYGGALGVNDGVAYVGAPGSAGRRGAVYVFQRAGDGAWRHVDELAPVSGGAGTSFGSALAVLGDRVIVGAAGADGGRGALYDVEMDGPLAWNRATRVVAGETGERGRFGSRIAVGDGVAVVGATGMDVNSGAAVILERGQGGAWLEGATVINEFRGFPALTGSEIHCVEGRAELFDCKDVNVISFLPIKDLGGRRGTRVNDLWGWTDPETKREYVIVGRSNGTAFVDITDPFNPRYLGELPMTRGSRDTIWRDIKVYRDHAYIVADNALEHGVQVFDLRQLRDVGPGAVTFTETFLYDGINSAHNIVINEETGFAYAVGNSGGGETCGGGLHMMDLADPARPVFAGCFADPATGRRRTGYSHDAQCVVYQGPDVEHQGKEVCFGSNETALNIADVTDKDAPVSIATASYPNVAYAHQGWLMEDHTYFYMNDEGDEPQGLVAGTRTLVWDVTDLDDPVLVKEHIAETTATDHNLYVRGDVMYQSNYSAGLRILDVSNPADPVEIGFFDTSPYEGGASWSNYPFFESGVIAVTGTGDGLFLLKNMARRNLVP